MLLLLLLLPCSLGQVRPGVGVETVYGPVVGGLRTTTTTPSVQGTLDQAKISSEKFTYA